MTTEAGKDVSALVVGSSSAAMITCASLKLHVDTCQKMYLW